MAVKHLKHTEDRTLLPCREAWSPGPLGFPIFELVLVVVPVVIVIPDSIVSEYKQANQNQEKITDRENKNRLIRELKDTMWSPKSKTGNKKREPAVKWVLNPLARFPIAWMASTATAMFTSVISCNINKLQYYLILQNGQSQLPQERHPVLAPCLVQI
nr:hypothetical protein Iba_chr06fCG4060 [Ipomoea batatas]